MHKLVVKQYQRDECVRVTILSKLCGFWLQLSILGSCRKFHCESEEVKCDLGGPFDPGGQGGQDDQPTCFHKICGFHGLNH